MRRATLALMVAVLGCGGGDNRTHGDFCDEVGDGFCAKMQGCGLASYNTCFQSFKLGCCANDGTCDHAYPNIDGARCVEQIGASLSCEEAASGTVPPACIMRAR